MVVLLLLLVGDWFLQLGRVCASGERRRWVGVDSRPCGTDVEETESGSYGWGGCVRKIEVRKEVLD